VACPLMLDEGLDSCEGRPCCLFSASPSSTEPGRDMSFPLFSASWQPHFQIQPVSRRAERGDWE
jgi:hypothetical protein